MPGRQGRLGHPEDSGGSTMTHSPAELAALARIYPGVRLTGADRQCTIALTGDLDVSAEPDMYLLVDPLLTIGMTDIVIDMTEVDFCNAAGVRHLLCAFRLAQARSAVLRVDNPPPHIKSVLDLTG